MRAVGEVLKARYTIEEAVSEELLGWVYRGRDLERQDTVQVKVLHEHIATDEKKFGRFLREVQATSMVRHVNTIELIDSGSQDGMHYLVMEDFPSRSLEDELADSERLSLERTGHIAAQIAAAIGAAHQESITHRALSPRNVLLLTNVRRGDFVKVRDFGLAKLERFDTNEEASHLTEAGMRVGNTAYMAPEYIENDRYHPKGDLYALGCLMTTMLTGKPPYTGRAADVLGDHVASPVPRPSKRTELPSWMDDLVFELLAKNPTDRPGAYQVVSRLEEGLGKRLGPPALTSDPLPPKPSKAARVIAPALLGAIAAGMLVIGLAFGAMAAAAVLVLFGVGTWQQAPDENAPVVIVEQSAPQAPAPVAPVAPAVPPGPGILPPAPVGPAPPTPPSVAPVPVPRAASYTTAVRVRSNRRVLVYLNGSPKGMTPKDIDVPPGEHRVSAVVPGESSTRQEQKVRLKENETVSVTFTF